MTWKISVAGLNGSGKSTLISRMVYNSNNVGLQPKPIQRKIVNLEWKGGKITAELLFLEISSDSDGERLLTGSNAIIVVTDLTNLRSLDYAENILKFVTGMRNKSIAVIVATKLDLRYSAQFWEDELQAISKRYKVPYFIVNSKSGSEWERVYSYITENLIQVFVKR